MITITRFNFNVIGRKKEFSPIIMEAVIGTIISIPIVISVTMIIAVICGEGITGILK